VTDDDAGASPDSVAGAKASSGDTRPDRPGGAAALIEALNVRRNAVRGFVFGFVFTVAVFTFFVVVPGVSRSPVYYVALAFVLATGLGALVTAALVLWDAYRLSKTL
jgi:fucose permease